MLNDGHTFQHRPVTIRFFQGCIPGRLLFRMYTNDILSVTNRVTLLYFAEDSPLSSMDQISLLKTPLRICPLLFAGILNDHEHSHREFESVARRCNVRPRFLDTDDTATAVRAAVGALSRHYSATLTFSCMPLFKRQRIKRK